MHVAVAVVPQRRLVAQLVDADPTVRRVAVARDEVPHPRGTVGGRERDARLRGRAGRDGGAAGGEPGTAAPPHPRRLPRVEVLLQRVLGGREPARERVRERPVLRDPADQRHLQHGRAAGGPVAGDHGPVRAVRGRVGAARRARRDAVGDVLVVPVAAAVLRRDAPVVALLVVAAPAVGGQLQLGDERRGRGVHPVDRGADRVPAGDGVDGQRRARHRRGGDAEEQAEHEEEEEQRTHTRMVSERAAGRRHQSVTAGAPRC
jgi:hypothetical protein